jgi:hypothetical protein
MVYRQLIGNMALFAAQLVDRYLPRLNSIFGAGGGIRTLDFRFKRPLL